ncbi:CAP-associated domain-containing protein [Filibacter tadaridae]|uniref:Cysteine-rich secretory protein family protein n=1 Tax=Filibacter tadaridae TaxID=2483811 RepID=A0A3P5XES8_9BACL|nr:CAP-associated domain-containing protein [Filibacter tadaridae]VDC29871.1 Cysteine-rich secretory protein family protein [Filibacter tadaridae]
MKVIWKIALLLGIVLVLFYYMDDRVQENDLLESPVKRSTAIPVPGNGTGSPMPQTSRPEDGISSFVGKDVDLLIEKMGKPDRIEPSLYGYDWWIYLGQIQFMAGVEKQKVNQIYSSAINSDVSPFEVGQDVKDIYRFSIVETEVDVQIDDNMYTFSLNSEDVKNRILVTFKDVYAQLYIDGIDGKLEGVRFIDPLTLVTHQPYDMAYRGEMISKKYPSSTVQAEVDRAMERQIFELSNIIREKHDVNKLERNYSLNILAREHSKEMALENYFSNDSPQVGNLAERLKESSIEHKQAGENIATNYVDAIEVVHGWLNSPEHRKVLLEEGFTHIGTGAYGRYYTQDFIRMVEDKKEEKGPGTF